MRSVDDDDVDTPWNTKTIFKIWIKQNKTQQNYTLAVDDVAFDFDLDFDRSPLTLSSFGSLETKKIIILKPITSKQQQKNYFFYFNNLLYYTINLQPIAILFHKIKTKNFLHYIKMK